MNKSLFFLIVFTVSFSTTHIISPALAQSPQDYVRIDDYTRSLNGQWHFIPNVTADINTPEKADNLSIWENISVPSNWYLQGYDFSGAAWYKRSFRIKPDDRTSQFSLQLTATDYTASVWVNGSFVGQQEGSFQRFEYDITPYLNVAGNNDLHILVDSPNEEDSAWSLRKRLIKGVLSHHDTRPGGAWSERGQEKNTGGIWGNVLLRLSKGIDVEDIDVTPILSGAESHTDIALLRITVTNYFSHSVESDIDLELTPDVNAKKTILHKLSAVDLKSGTSTLTVRLPVTDALRWWPVGHGTQPLYSVRVKVNYSHHAEFDVAQHPLDIHTERFGFRTVAHDPTDGIWHINGKRLFLRGTNYIASQWLSEMSEEKFRRDIELMLSAGVNIVRVHAHVEPKAFYRLCDEYGLLVWQDFPLQWGYADSPEFTRNAINQAHDMVDDFYNHPSIIVWSLHNEPPWDADWMKYKYPDYQPQQNQQLDNALYDKVSQEDNSRYVHKYSATSEHPWFGWYSGVWQDYGKPTERKLITEFGAQALPRKKTLSQFLSSDELWPDSESEWEKWEYHNFQRRENFELAKVSMGENIDEFIENSQSYQARLIRYAAESYRRQRYQPVGAIFQFMFVENWASMNWAVVDYLREPKRGYYAMQNAYQMILPSIEWKKSSYRVGESLDIGLWAINDKWDDYANALYRYVIIRKPGEEISNRAISIDLKADSSLELERLSVRLTIPGNYELIVTIEDSQGKLLGKNSHRFDVIADGYAQN